MIYEVSALDFVVFSENYRPTIRSEAISDTLIFGEGVTSSIKPLYFNDSIIFREIIVFNGDFNLSINDSLDFTEATCPRAFIVSIDDLLFLVDEFDIPKHSGLSESILFNETLSLNSISKVAPDELTFVETISLLKTVKYPLNETLIFTDNSTCIRLGDGDRPGQILFQTLTTYITFTDDQARELRLPYPKFGDTENFHFDRINRQARDLTPIITNVPTWNRTQLFKMEFEIFDIQIIENLKIFIRNNLGRPVTVIDHNSVVRSVIIQNPDREISTIGRDYFNVTLDCYEVLS